MGIWESRWWWCCIGIVGGHVIETLYLTGSLERTASMLIGGLVALLLFWFGWWLWHNVEIRRK